MPRPVFHVGYHKTASTFLQQGVFDSDTCFHRVPRRSIYDHLIYPSPLVFDDEIGIDFVNAAVDRARAGGQVPVFSNERLSGGLHTGGHDCVEIMSRIKRCAPNARVLLCVREQESMIRSLHSQYVKAFGVVSLENYCAGQYTKYNKDLFNLTCLEYDRLVSAYFEVFGADNVTVLPFELLVQNREQFLDDIYRACGLRRDTRGDSSSSDCGPRNSRRPALQSRFLRLTGPLRQSSIPHVGPTYCVPGLSWLVRGAAAAVGRLPLKSIDAALVEKDKKRVSSIVGNRYIESNRKLQRLTGLDLGSFGYML